MEGESLHEPDLQQGDEFDPTAMAQLEDAVTRHPLNREVLYKTLSLCSQELTLEEAEARIASLPEFARATQNQHHLLMVLVEAGGLRLVERDAEGAVISATAAAGMSEDEHHDAVAFQSFETTQLGLRFVDQHRPQARLVELLNLAPERADVYRELLAFVDEQPRSYANVAKLLAGRPVLETVLDGERIAMQPSVFLDKLERAGALVWNKGWSLTEEGKAFLEDLKSNDWH